jgi:hypothetical protein
MKKAKRQVVAEDSNVMHIADFREKVVTEGKVVFEHGWDSGGPGFYLSLTRRCLLPILLHRSREPLPVK